MGAMQQARRHSREKPRELRRRVLMPARLRSSSGWTDACILNISSRGLMIHSSRAGPKGSMVELWRGDHVIVARVMWQDGARAGLQTDERLAVEDILSLSASAALTLTASEPYSVERRARPRDEADPRSQGRMLEFFGVVAIGCVVAASAYGMVQQALAHPMAMIRAALG
jgi:hypothetical protein